MAAIPYTYHLQSHSETQERLSQPSESHLEKALPCPWGWGIVVLDMPMSKTRLHPYFHLPEDSSSPPKYPSSTDPLHTQLLSWPTASPWWPSEGRKKKSMQLSRYSGYCFRCKKFILSSGFSVNIHQINFLACNQNRISGLASLDSDLSILS